MKKLLLVGGGHAHLHVVKMLKEDSIPNVEVTLISPSQYQFYSGMFSGFAEGIYDKSQISIDLKQLTEQSPVTWLEGAVLSIDTQNKSVLTDKGDVKFFDVISFDIGSFSTKNNTDDIYQIKPNNRYMNVIEKVREAEQLVMIGGGLSGIEISLSLQAWRNANRIDAPVTLISEDRLLKHGRIGVSEKIEKIVKEKGVQLCKHETVTEVENHRVKTSADHTYTYDKLIWLSEPKAAGIFKTSGLPTDQKGFLLVEDTLQVKKFPFIFGAGECITLTNYPNLDKNSIHSIKQGPVLFENIKGYFQTGNGSNYSPNKDYLSIISIGNREAFLFYKGFAYSGKWPWKLKHRIDTNFVKQFM